MIAARIKASTCQPQITALLRAACMFASPAASNAYTSCSATCNDAYFCYFHYYSLMVWSIIDSVKGLFEGCGWGMDMSVGGEGDLVLDFRMDALPMR